MRNWKGREMGFIRQGDRSVFDVTEEMS